MILDIIDNIDYHLFIQLGKIICTYDKKLFGKTIKRNNEILVKANKHFNTKNGYKIMKYILNHNMYNHSLLKNITFTSFQEADLERCKLYIKYVEYEQFLEYTAYESINKNAGLINEKYIDFIFNWLDNKYIDKNGNFYTDKIQIIQIFTQTTEIKKEIIDSLKTKFLVYFKDEYLNQNFQ
jgi:hypothetical protein